MGESSNISRTGDIRVIQDRTHRYLSDVVSNDKGDRMLSFPLNLLDVSEELVHNLPRKILQGKSRQIVHDDDHRPKKTIHYFLQILGQLLQGAEVTIGNPGDVGRDFHILTTETTLVIIIIHFTIDNDYILWLDVLPYQFSITSSNFDSHLLGQQGFSSIGTTCKKSNSSLVNHIWNQRCLRFSSVVDTVHYRFYLGRIWDLWWIIRGLSGVIFVLKEFT